MSASRREHLRLALRRDGCDSIHRVTTAPDTTADDIDALQAALAAERLARRRPRRAPPAPRRWWRTSSC